MTGCPSWTTEKPIHWLDLFDAMYKGEFNGFFAWGQNPAGSGANANKTRKALAKLDWMVNVNIFDNETGSFWKGPGMDPGKIKTEVFMLPCAVSVEKEGSITNSGRWSQWRYKAAEPPGDARPDGDILIELMKKVKWFYRKAVKQGENPVFPEPILNLKWDYTTDGRVRLPQDGQRDQRLFPEGCDRQWETIQERGPGAEFCLSPGRRLHQQRKLALLQLLHRQGQHGRKTQEREIRHRA